VAKDLLKMTIWSNPFTVVECVIAAVFGLRRAMTMLGPKTSGVYS